MNKNVLFIHHVSCLAGAERYLLSVIEALDPSYKVFFICQEHGPLSEALIKRGVTVQYMKLGAWRKVNHVGRNLRSITEVVQFCRKHHIGLICSNNYRVTSYAVWPAKMLKIPAMTIIQDFVDRAKLRKFNTFESDCLVSVSNSIADGIGRFKNKVTVYNGIDVLSFTAALKKADVLREQFPQLEGKVIVGMIAHIIPLKGHKDFLEAMQKVAKSYPDAAFVIIGDSPNPRQLSLDDIKAYAKELKLSDRVVFTGARSDVPDLLKSFDILVHPSHREAFGRVIMEAMALSVPVIATRCGGPSEIIEDGVSGFLVPVSETDLIAERVDMLLADEAKRRLIGQQGLKRIQSQFSIDKTVGQMSNVIKKLLKGS